MHLTLVCLEACLSVSLSFLEVKGGWAHAAPGTDLACRINVGSVVGRVWGDAYLGARHLD